MHKKTSLYVKFLIVSMFCLTSCVSGCASSSLNAGAEKEILPRHSFVQIRHAVELEGCGLDPISKEKRYKKAVMRYVSSGSFVFHSEVSRGVSYVLTAGHSCKNRFPKKQNINGFEVNNKGSKFVAVSLNGFKHPAEVVQINERFDLCLMRVKDVFRNPPVMKLADKEPTRGETVSNMAAPHGLFWMNTVLIFKGQFSGFHREGYSVYTIPTKPGSSGSPILNKNNKLIGLIFAGYQTIETVALSSPLVAIKVFLKKAIAKGEMQLWEKDNTPKVDTQVDRLWIKKMQTKLDEVFGQ
mgnify:CR=1 FL=1